MNVKRSKSKMVKKWLVVTVSEIRCYDSHEVFFLLPFLSFSFFFFSFSFLFSLISFKKEYLGQCLFSTFDLFFFFSFQESQDTMSVLCTFGTLSYVDLGVVLPDYVILLHQITGKETFLSFGFFLFFSFFSFFFFLFFFFLFLLSCFFSLLKTIGV